MGTREQAAIAAMQSLIQTRRSGEMSEGAIRKICEYSVKYADELMRRLNDEGRQDDGVYL